MILWVLVSLFIAEGADYRKCDRDTRHFYDHIKCENVGLNGIPVNLPKTVKRLTIRDDDLSHDFEFPTLPELTRLTLTNVSIKRIPSKAFANLYQLIELIISKNDIQSIADDAFHDLFRLEQLRLGGNNIRELPDYMVKDSTKLKLIYLNNNRLVKISANLFKPLLPKARQLQLNFDHNRISTIEDGAFDIVKNIKHPRIYLRNNTLTTWNPYLFSIHKNAFVRLKDNPINCDCNLQIPHNFADREVHCVKPANLAGTRIYQLRGQTLPCNAECEIPNIEHGQVTHEAGTLKPGEALSVTCRDGYELSHFLTIKCLSDGSFSEELPACLTKKEAIPKELDDGSVLIESGSYAVYPNYITTSCPTSMILKTCKCTEQYCSGAILNNNNSCTVVPALNFPTKAQVTCLKSQDIADVYTFSKYENVRHKAQCKMGYSMSTCTIYIPDTKVGNHATMVPDEKSICSVDCDMTECNLYIRCIKAIEKKSCEKFSIHLATIYPPMTPTSTFVAGDVVTITCDKGYSLYSEDGGNTVTCVEGFKTTPELPYCYETVVECTIGELKNAIATPDWPTVPAGKSATLSCGSGFEGDDVVVNCGDDGKWEKHPQIQCKQKVPVQCTLTRIDRVVANPGWTVTEPGAITLTCSDQYKGDSVVVKCQEDFNPTPNIICRERGNCQVGRFTNAIVTIRDNEPLTEYFIIEDEKIQFQCGKGYLPKYPVIATCLPVGQLDKKLPKCEKDEDGSKGCSVPRIKHGKVEGHKFGSQIKPGVTITVRCEEGYELQDNEFYQLKCISQQYYEPNYLPRCIEKDVSCEVPVLNNGHYPGYRAGGYILKEEQLIPQCFTGYILTGPVIIVCQDGSFGNEPNACVTPDISCNIPIIKHGRVLHENLPFKADTTFDIICDNGYWNKYSEITCVEAPNYYDPLDVPECQMPDGGCAKVAFPFMEELDTVLAGQTVTVKCKEGYKLHGKNTITCGDDNRYIDNNLPSCIPSSGCEIPKIEYGGTESILTHVENGTDIHISCNEGYDVYGDTILKCESGTLSGLVTPKCIKKEDLDSDCDMPFVDYGYFVANNMINPGSTLELVCDDGYEVEEGNNKIMCMTENTFEPSVLPKCVLSKLVTSDSCRPMHIENGEFSPNKDIDIGESATITCNIGYTISGSSVINCINTGTFATTPYCEKELPKCDVPVIENGEVSPQQPIVEGSKYFVECNNGYDIQGDGSIICKSNGETIPPAGHYPTCTKAKPPCKRPFIENGFMITPDDGRAYAVGEETHLVCNSNYKPYDDFQLNSLKTMCMGDDVFFPPIRQCIYAGTECELPIIDNGSIHPPYIRMKPFDRFQIICNEGYKLSGATEIMCLSDGNYDRLIPKCSKVDHPCVSPMVENGIINGPSPLVTNDRFSVECNAGFKLIGAKIISCWRDEKYSDPLPVCQKINTEATECRKIVIQNGYYIGSLLAGHYIQVMCQEGYSILGDNRLLCQSDGNYDKPTPQCAKKENMPDMGCGTRDPKYMGPRVFGGQEARPGEYPWNVLIESTRGRFCGGAIINENWVLTAGHCLTSHNQICDKDCSLMKTSDILAIKAGVHTRSDDSSSWQIRKAVELFTHPYFKIQRTYIDYDVGLIHVNESFVYDQTVNRICLPKEGVDNLVSNQELFVSGWGKTNVSLTSDSLQFIEVPYVDRNICNSNESYDGVITSRMFCAGYKLGKIDACQGDSGGPLAFLGSNGTFVQGGIVSWGNGCALENFYGVYTNLAYFYDWIMNYVKVN